MHSIEILPEGHEGCDRRGSSEIEVIKLRKKKVLPAMEKKISVKTVNFLLVKSQLAMAESSREM